MKVKSTRHGALLHTMTEERKISKVSTAMEALPIVGNPRIIRRLFSDGGRSIITDYHQKTGIIPVNHMVVVKQHIWISIPGWRSELL